MIRRKALFSGHVQGVGFRYTTHRIALCMDVAGYVKNLPDGRVEAVIEGEEAEVRRVIDEITAEMSHHLDEVKTNDSTPTGEFLGFEIRF